MPIETEAYANRQNEGVTLLEEERIGQGRDNAKQYLKENPELADSLEEQIRAKLMEGRAAAKAAATPAGRGIDVSADDFDDAD